MAIKELWDSQELHVTSQGTTATRKYSCTWADALNGNDGSYWLPVIGNYWSPERQDLLCTDLDLTANGRVNVIVSALFSTEDASVRRKRREDFNESWEESFELFGEETPEIIYYDTVAGEYKSWAASWITAGGSLEKKPELFQFRPKGSFYISAYGSSNRMAQILTHINKVNKFAFLKHYLLNLQKSYIITQDDPEIVNFNDVGKWMFMGARVDRIRSTCWRFDYTFLYDALGWNSAGTSPTVTTNQYEKFDFPVLFDGMSFIDDDGEAAFAAQDNNTLGGF